MSDIKFKYNATYEYRFWLYDPEGDGITYWRDKDERDDATKKLLTHI